MSDGGKGDKPRPINIPQKQFDDAWDVIFKPKEKPNGTNEVS